MRLPSVIHRAAIAQGEPAARDPVDEPQAHDAERQPDEDDADAERQHDEEEAERDPQQSVPERTNLPLEMGFEPGATRFTALHVIENHRDDGWPADEKCP